MRSVFVSEQNNNANIYCVFVDFDRCSISYRRISKTFVVLVTADSFTSLQNIRSRNQCSRFFIRPNILSHTCISMMGAAMSSTTMPTV